MVITGIHFHRKKSMRASLPAFGLILLTLLPGHALAETNIVCTIVMDAKTSAVVLEEGDCDTRAPAASTFKIAISLMGFDAGFLKSAHEPSLPFKEGYPDWIPAWRSDTDPAKWMKQSVVWYSQQITTGLGRERFAGYVKNFDYGNQDVTGDPGKNNGLTRSWLSSSLEISPREQVAFLGRMMRRELPVSTAATAGTMALTEIGQQPSGWLVGGKTGSAPSKNRDGSKASAKPWGWFVGWATKGDRSLVFARLTKDTTKPAQSSGLAAREAVLSELFAGKGKF
jgi:beta-lactamase class D